jgi:hypothetical protein
VYRRSRLTSGNAGSIELPARIVAERYLKSPADRPGFFSFPIPFRVAGELVRFPTVRVAAVIANTTLDDDDPILARQRFDQLHP